MIKKAGISFMIFLGLVLMSTIHAVAVDDSLTVTDASDDVSQYNSTTGELIGTYAVPNIDITEVKAEKTGDSITVTLTMSEDGEIEKNLDSAYGIYLITTSPYLFYFIAYTGLDLSEYGFGSGEVLVLHGDDEGLVTVDSYLVEDNIMTLSFKLDSADERIIGLSASTEKTPGGGKYSYADEAPDGFEDLMMSLTPDAGSDYNATVGKSVNFQATLEEGNPDDYEWVWVFEDSGTTLTGPDPSHTFKIPGTYSGIVYVFDGEGNWGTTEFSTEVSGTASDKKDGDDNGSPGFELIILFAAIAVIIGAIVIFKRK